MKGSLLALVIGAAAIAVLGTSYALSQFAFVATWAIAGLGLSLILGQAGQISLGHGAFQASVPMSKARWRSPAGPPGPLSAGGAGGRRRRLVAALPGGDSVAWLSR